ncbi:MAG: orotidine 5'-phosphate decarboxylase [Aigarchaeota archaeon]|nr:orotidine 5'-phosphate decarboxylase [Aigarchaeota archaeon]MDW8092561.1 orotidine 5'-phosphate decarboxylase / HUMPS family protein [Nitrososphaerota archaeon]
MFEKLWRLSREKNSRLIVAIDEEGVLKGLEGALRSLERCAVGIKLGYVALIVLSIEKISSIISEWRDDFYFMADLKLADIPHINEQIGKRLLDAGFDGATVHLFQRGLEEVRMEALPELIGILAMSHRSVLLDRLFETNLRYARRVGMKGVVVGARKRSIIASAKRGGFVVFSPGIGAQGGRDVTALTYGADFEIVGRRLLIDPRLIEDAAEAYVNKQREVLSSGA